MQLGFSILCVKKLESLCSYLKDIYCMDPRSCNKKSSTANIYLLWVLLYPSSLCRGSRPSGISFCNTSIYLLLEQLPWQADRSGCQWQKAKNKYLVQLFCLRIKQQTKMWPRLSGLGLHLLFVFNLNLLCLRQTGSVCSYRLHSLTELSLAMRVWSLLVSLQHIRPGHIRPKQY